MRNYFVYLLVMAGVTYLVRALPLLLVKKKIENRFLLSFLHYIPYAVLSVMTIPACFFATGHVGTALCGFVVAMILAYWGKSLVVVAAGAAGGVLLGELVVTYLLPLL